LTGVGRPFDHETASTSTLLKVIAFDEWRELRSPKKKKEM